jgi:hypothetical protein
MKSSETTNSELLAALAQLRRIHPDWRLGQIVANLATTAGCLDAAGEWDLEDEQALAAARSLIQQYSEYESGVVASLPAVNRQNATAFESSQ